MQNICLLSMRGGGKIAAANTASYSKNKILADLLNKTKTYTGSDTTVKNDLGFIKTIILPAFVKLYEKWPDAYNLLMKSNLEIAIIKYDSAIFYAKHKDEQKNKYYFTKTTTCTASFCIDKSIICVNTNDYYKKIFPVILFLEDVFHETMHAVSYFSLKDGGKIEKLSSYLDKNGSLTLLTRNYIARQNKAIKELLEWKKANIKKYKNANDFYRAFYKQYLVKIKQHRCWAARKLHPNYKENIKEFFMRCFPNMNEGPAEEMLAEGLSHYYGTMQEHNALKKYEPALYSIIKNKVITIVKNAPVDAGE